MGEARENMLLIWLALMLWILEQQNMHAKE